MEIELSNQLCQQIEIEILKVIDKCQELFSTFSTNAKKNIEIVLLVGTTGAGKSTLFNFLSGADFKIQDRELKLKNPSNKFSEMKGGMSSVTKEPKYHFNSEYNHFLIDFPGFQDTDGELDQLLMELLFQKVVTSMPIKVVYVLKNNESTLPNRGIQIIEFVDQLFKNSNLSINKFNLLLNCYLENLSDEELIRNIRMELKQANKNNYIDNILIVRKVLNSEDLNIYFANGKRNEQWQKLEQIKPIQLKPKTIPKTDIFSKYLRQQILLTVDEYDDIITRNVDQLCQGNSDPKNDGQIKQAISLIENIVKEKTTDISQWYTNFIQTCEKIPGDQKIQKNVNNLKQILHYCSQFSNQIENYSEVVLSIQRAQQQFQALQKHFIQKIERQQQQIEMQARITDLEEDGMQLQQDLKEQRQQNQNSQLEIARQNQSIQNQQQQINYQQILNQRLEDRVEASQEQNRQLQNNILEVRKEQERREAEFRTILAQQQQERENMNAQMRQREIEQRYERTIQEQQQQLVQQQRRTDELHEQVNNLISEISTSRSRNRGKGKGKGKGKCRRR